MGLPGILQIVVFLAMLLVLAKPFGIYMAKVYSGERTFLGPMIEPVERLIYQLCGIDPVREQKWTVYTAAMLLFNLGGMLLLYAIQRLQAALPLNPAGIGPVPPDLAFGEAASFTTNTNWQSYVPETMVTYLTQMTGYAFHNFVSAATGMAIAIALVRGLSRRSGNSIGNFWADLVRSTLYVLLPISIIFGLVLVWQGVPQNFNDYTQVQTVEGATQTIAHGPVASQEVIKELGTNGGGIFNANSAHPYENPNPFTDILEMWLILCIPVGFLYMFGRLVGDTRQGWALLAAVATIFILGLIVAETGEQGGNPLIAHLGVDQQSSALQAGGNFEGKEVRFGISASALWAVVTTATSCGAVNAMHDSFMPLAGMVPLVNIQLGEVVFGGVGVGLYGLLVYAIIAVFIAGLMVGRTPEYLGKKIQSYEVKMAMLSILILALSILGFTALASATDAGTSSILNPGPHGFSEMLYVYSSSTGNNGSAFAGINANTLFYNSTTGLAQLFGRFLMIVPILAIAGSMARKQRVVSGLGTFPTYGALWTGLLVGVILIVGALTFFPALALGPIVEQLLLVAGQTF